MPKSPLTVHSTSLEAHESIPSHLEPGEIADADLTPALIATLNTAADLNDRLASLTAREKALADSTFSLALTQRLTALRARNVPHQIGGRTGTPPTPGFDIFIQTIGPDPSVPNLPRQVAWVPVILAPMPIKDPKPASSQYGPSFILGRTSVQQSLSTALVATNSPKTPLDPINLALRRVSLKAYCVITVNPQSPEEVLASLERHDSTTSLSSVSHPDDDPSSPAFSSSPLPPNTAANIASANPPPFLSTTFNPSQSPASPFTPSGNTAASSPFE